MSADIYWIVGYSTDVGKTSVATTLIKLLNSEGKPTVGYKPFGASMLPGDLEFILANYPNPHSKLFGGDCKKLADSSPLTTQEHLDIIAPLCLLCSPYGPAGTNTAIIIRVGAKLLGDVSYYVHSSALEYHKREDVKKFMQHIELPINCATVHEYADMNKFLFLPRASELQNKALKYLEGLGAESIVCESAGGRLPMWKDSPPTNHIFFIEGGRLYLYHGINELLHPPVDRIPFCFDLPLLQRKDKCISEPIELDISGSIHNSLKRTIKTLLIRAGILT
jgi:hypothetical protein